MGRRFLQWALFGLLVQGAFSRSVSEGKLGRRSREGRRPHNTETKGSVVVKEEVFTEWDGQPSWEWDNPRTLYFEPIAGLGNRLRALASAVVIAREWGVGIKVIWREEEECGEGCGWAPPFNSTWPDLFSAPKLRLAPNFPGSNYSVHREHIALVEDAWIRYPGMDPVIAGFNCSVHIVNDHKEMAHHLTNSWTHVHGEQVLCIKSDAWLTKHGERDAKFFFRLLQPSLTVQKLINDFKKAVNWDHFHIIGAHIRRTDLAITQPDGSKKRMDALLSLSKYIDPLRKLTALVPSQHSHEIRYFMATDDAEAEKLMKSSFGEGLMLTYPKTVWARDKVEGIQQALVEVMLLAECPVLLGTYYSSYSEAAKLMGWPYYIQVGGDLREQSVELQFEGGES